MRNVLTQAAGVQSSPLNVHIVEQKLQSGDMYLICSDGLHGVIGDPAIRSILGAGEMLERTAQSLREAARGCGGPDNISAVLLSFGL
jgi:protein phosphatase